MHWKYNFCLYVCLCVLLLLVFFNDAQIIRFQSDLIQTHTQVLNTQETMEFIFPEIISDLLFD